MEAFRQFKEFNQTVEVIKNSWKSFTVGLKLVNLKKTKRFKVLLFHSLTF